MRSICNNGDRSFEQRNRVRVVGNDCVKKAWLMSDLIMNM
jgi:hypothetical protein